MLDKVRMNFWIPKAMYAHVEAIAIRDGRSMSDVIRESLRDYARRDQDAHQSFYKENPDGQRKDQ